MTCSILSVTGILNLNQEEKNMKKQFNTKAASQGGAGIALSVTLIYAGVLIMLDVLKDNIAWGTILIVAGVSFFIGMMWFGFNVSSVGE